MNAWRRTLLTASLTVATFSFVGIAQTQAPPSPLGPVPTTKVLAIGSLTTPLTPAQRRSIMPQEVPATVRLYLDGKIDQWWVRQDGKGVVFLMNVTSAEEAQALLDKLPLGEAHLMSFQFIPLGPLSPLRVLLVPPAAAAPPGQ